MIMMMMMIQTDLLPLNTRLFRQGKQPVECVDEVAKYLMESSEKENDKTFNILAWWKYNSNKYSILSQFA